MQAISSLALPVAATPKRDNTIILTFIHLKAPRINPMSYPSLVFAEYGMTNVSNFNCVFAHNSKPKSGTKKG